MMIKSPMKVRESAPKLALVMVSFSKGRDPKTISASIPLVHGVPGGPRFPGRSQGIKAPEYNPKHFHVDVFSVGPRVKRPLTYPNSRNFSDIKPVHQVSLDHHQGTQVSSLSTRFAEAVGHYYSLPYHLIKASVEIRQGPESIECFHWASRVASHVKSYDHLVYTPLPEYRPPADQYYLE